MDYTILRISLVIFWRPDAELLEWLSSMQCVLPTAAQGWMSGRRQVKSYRPIAMLCYVIGLCLDDLKNRECSGKVIMSANRKNWGLLELCSESQCDKSLPACCRRAWYTCDILQISGVIDQANLTALLLLDDFISCQTLPLLKVPNMSLFNKLDLMMPTFLITRMELRRSTNFILHILFVTDTRTNQRLMI